MTEKASSNSRKQRKADNETWARDTAKTRNKCKLCKMCRTYTSQTLQVQDEEQVPKRRMRANAESAFELHKEPYNCHRSAHISHDRFCGRSVISVIQGISFFPKIRSYLSRWGHWHKRVRLWAVACCCLFKDGQGNHVNKTGMSRIFTWTVVEWWVLPVRAMGCGYGLWLWAICYADEGWESGWGAEWQSLWPLLCRLFWKPAKNF